MAFTLALLRTGTEKTGSRAEGEEQEDRSGTTGAGRVKVSREQRRGQVQVSRLLRGSRVFTLSSTLLETVVRLECQ